MSTEHELEENEVKLPLKIKLRKPIATPDDGMVDVLEITREPNGGDIAGLNLTATNPGDFLRVASRLTGIPYPFMSKVSAKDAINIMNALVDFLV